MVMSMEQFFPEAEVELPSGVDIPRQSTSSHDSERRIPLQRINTGISSIVGSKNGDRPGGFVLVVDGAALLQVGSFLLSLYLLPMLWGGY
jgi:phospholipid-translocating ATPase